MALVVRSIYNTISLAFEEGKDPRVEHLPLVGSPLLPFGIVGFYLLFVYKWGPQFMESRKPYNLKRIITVYNGLQVVTNLGLFIWGVKNSYLRPEWNFLCQPIDFSNNEPWMQNLIWVSYGYYLTKYLDLMDTVFFVLRKKTKQISFLHVYHHACMVLGVYIFMKFLVGSHSTTLGVINLLVHVIMYGYYFTTSLRPDLAANLWWKRYITQVQLLQFGYLMIHFALVIFRNTCQHPDWVGFLGLTQNLFMFVLFMDFYIKTYGRKAKTH